MFHSLRRSDCSYNLPSLQSTCRHMYVHSVQTTMCRNPVVLYEDYGKKVFPWCPPFHSLASKRHIKNATKASLYECRLGSQWILWLLADIWTLTSAARPFAHCCKDLIHYRKMTAAVSLTALTTSVNKVELIHLYFKLQLESLKTSKERRKPSGGHW